MSRPRILSPEASANLSRAYVAGTPCTELARYYGVSPSYVINTAKAWQIEQSLRRLKTLERQVRRQQIVPPPIEMPEPSVSFRHGQRVMTVRKRYSQTKPNGGGIVDAQTVVALPYISLQHPKGD